MADVELFRINLFTTAQIPLVESLVSAGFPSPADDYLETPLDLNRYVTNTPESTFFVRVSGNSMKGAGIFPNDLLVVDKTHEIKPGLIVVAVLDGEFLLKRLRQINGKWFLCPENSEYQKIEITDEIECFVWGVATYVVHSLI